MSINPNFLFDWMKAYALRLDKLTHADHIMTQIHHPTDTSTFLLSPRYQVSHFSHSDYAVLVQGSLFQQVLKNKFKYS